MNSLLLHLIHQQLARGSRQVADVGGLQKSPLLLAATPLEQGELKEEKESKGKEEEEEEKKKTLAPPYGCELGRPLLPPLATSHQRPSQIPHNWSPFIFLP